MLIEQLKEYSDHYNEERAIPSIVDGLKPVQRKLLYIGVSQNLHKKKLVQFVGETMKIYLHGDNALIETAYRMAQPWKQTYPLFTGEGNFGSQASLGLSGSGASAARYLTVSLSELGKAYMGIHKTGINTMFVNPLTGEKEPETLFIPIPAFLLYNQLGIGVGVATNFPSFTLDSIINTTVDLLQNPQSPLSLAPVFQSGCEIVNKSELPKVLAGEGSLRLRAKYEIKGDTIEVHSFPPTTCPQYIISEIEKLEGKVVIFDNIVDMQDISSTSKGKVDVRLRIKLKKSTHKEAFIKMLNLETSCETTVPFNLTLLGTDNKPHKYSAKTALLEWIEVFKDKSKQSLNMEQTDLENRKHILDGLIKALDDIDEIIALIKSSKSKSEAREKLNSRGYSDAQANAILDMKLSKLANMEYQELLNELENIHGRLDNIAAILSSDTQFIAHLISILNSYRKYEIYSKGCTQSDSATVRVKDKTEEVHTAKMMKGKLIIDKGGVDISKAVIIQNNRVKAIGVGDNGAKIDMLLDDTLASLCLLTISKDNRIKRTAISELIGSRNAIYTKQEDIIGMFVCNDTDGVEITTTNGKLSFGVNEVPISGKGALGVKAIKLKDDEKIISAIITDKPKYKRYTATHKK